MVMYCPECGAANEDIAEFCVNCGVHLAKARDLKADAKESTTKKKRQEQEGTTAPPPSEKKLYRSRDNVIVTGLAAGMADYFNMDPGLMRLLWILFIFVFTGGTGLIVYIIMAILIEEEPPSSSSSSKGQTD
ncbi:MAG: PspC domain-containing protein [Candidatus Heimdallarchaeota archaeon]|nr:PspC domain-containing protein [Candidatus Heimdallarchaeota archaeon]